jgi:hypothetical protein
VTASEDYRQQLWDRWHAADDGPGMCGIREEWEVTSSNPGEGYPPYRFVFGNPGEGRYKEPGSTPEQRAREFVAAVAEHGGWPSPIKLRSRVIVDTPWVDE